MVFHHMRRWTLAMIAFTLIAISVAACNTPYSNPAPGNGTPAPTSPSGY